MPVELDGVSLETHDTNGHQVVVLQLCDIHNQFRLMATLRPQAGPNTVSVIMFLLVKPSNHQVAHQKKAAHTHTPYLHGYGTTVWAVAVMPESPQPAGPFAREQDGNPVATRTRQRRPPTRCPPPPVASDSRRPTRSAGRWKVWLAWICTRRLGTASSTSRFCMRVCARRGEVSFRGAQGKGWQTAG